MIRPEKSIQNSHAFARLNRKTRSGLGLFARPILRNALFIVLLAAGAAPLCALDLGFAKEDGGQAGAFLDFAASARSLGMGRAHAAVADDASAGYWNPAGLSQLERKDVVALYSQLFEETDFGSISFALPTIDWGTFGVSVAHLRSVGFKGRNDQAIETGEFDLNDTAILLSNGMRIRETLSIGLTAKVIRQKVQAFDDVSYGADVGFLWTPHSAFQIGFAAKNVIAPEITLKKESDTFPLDLRLGMKYELGSKWLFAVDVNQVENRSLKPHIGAEYAVSELVALRGGLMESEMTAGLGVWFGDMGIDYAFGFNDAASGIDDLGASHRAGFRMKFGSRVADEKRSVRWQRRGRAYLTQLKKRMADPAAETDEPLGDLVSGAKRVIRRQGYLNPIDLYAAQGYVYFFEGELERSVRALYEATILDPADRTLQAHYEKARAQMTEEQARTIIEYEVRKVRDLFKAGDLHGTVRSCRTILSYDPEHVEAKAYLEDAEARIREPIERELKIAKAKFERDEHLEAMRHLLKVQELDPDNAEAARFMAHALGALKEQAKRQIAVKRRDETTARTVYELGYDPEKSQRFYGQGLLLYSKGELKQAVDSWQKAISFDKSNTLALNAYNRALLELNDNR